MVKVKSREKPWYMIMVCGNNSYSETHENKQNVNHNLQRYKDEVNEKINNNFRRNKKKWQKSTNNKSVQMNLCDTPFVQDFKGNITQYLHINTSNVCIDVGQTQTLLLVTPYCFYASSNFDIYEPKYHENMLLH